MTEGKWYGLAEPEEMLNYLGGKASRRKVRLFGVACCRRNWNLLSSDVSQPGVEVVERYADGLATDPELEAVHQAARPCPTRS